MAEEYPAVTFGPIPSRRLGQSLGVNNIPPKHCTYSCVYCQLGRTPNMIVERRTFYRPDVIADAVRRRLEECEHTGVRIDYLTLVPDGEPTLDANLGPLLRELRRLGPPVALITNGSLIHRKDVRDELSLADWVSVKVDAADASTWHLIDRPHRKLDLEETLEGLRIFARSCDCTLVTETMLVAGVNDHDAAFEAIAGYLETIGPEVAYLAVPTRPPAESSVDSPGARSLIRAFSTLSRLLPRVELLAGDPHQPLTPSSDVERDLLAITAVHPLDDKAIVELGGGSLRALRTAEDLAQRGLLTAASHRGRRFFVRSFARRPGRSPGDSS